VRQLATELLETREELGGWFDPNDYDPEDLARCDEWNREHPDGPEMSALTIRHKERAAQAVLEGLAIREKRKRRTFWLDVAAFAVSLLSIAAGVIIAIN